jgi:prepilin peptidase CpaA
MQAPVRVQKGCIVSWVPWVIATLVVLAAAVSDVRAFRIPNALTFPALIAGLAYHALRGGWGELQSSLTAVMVGGGLLLLLYALGLMGAGDVKLMAAVGAWLGMPGTYDVFVISALATGVCSAVMVVAQRRLGAATWKTLRLMLYMLTFGRFGKAERVEVVVRQSDRRRRLIPFAAMMTVGMLVVGGVTLAGR